MFIHFEPTGRELGKGGDGHYYLKRKNQKEKSKEVDRLYREQTRSAHGGQSSSFDGQLPPYIQRESPEEEYWLLQHPTGWEPVSQLFLS